MKVIDLLNKIANGEATNESEFILKGEGQITNMNFFADEYLFNTEMLNRQKLIIDDMRTKINRLLASSLPLCCVIILATITRDIVNPIPKGISVFKISISCLDKNVDIIVAIIA